MLIKLFKQLKTLSHSRWYWGSALFSGIALLSIALIYQHVLGERPCLLCIQIRLWVSLFVLASFVGFLVRHNPLMNSVAHLSVVLIAGGLVERSYQLLGTERGFIFGDCGFDLGLPVWFAIDKWLPSVYYVETACGYTPEIIFGITMAEALMVFSAGLLLVSVGISVASFLKRSE
ncbi:MAG: disulfide bond formation protein B [Gammaproteobacteria bacterium]|nr:disulfide bond formation protein B [Gammaproteobacteria bacterium]